MASYQVLNSVLLSVKQNLSPAWLLGPQAKGKLTISGILSSVKQNLSLAWLLEPQAKGKLTTFDTRECFFFLIVRQSSKCNAYYLSPLDSISLARGLIHGISG